MRRLEVRTLSLLAIVSMSALAFAAPHGTADVSANDGPARDNNLLPLWREVFKRPPTSPLSAIPTPNGAPLSNELVDLGRRLFSDRRLSGPEDRSCASCHQPSLAFTDGRPRAVSREPKSALANTPAILGLAWAGRPGENSEPLDIANAVRRPIESPKEMAGNWREIRDRLAGDDDVTRAFEREFPGAAQPLTYGNLIEAVSAYVLSLRPPISRFDRYIAGDDQSLSSAEQAGFRLFVGKAGCVACHAGWRLTDDRRHAIGLAALNAVGSSTSGPVSLPRRTPSLRQLALTAPYMSDGSKPTLADVLDHYTSLTADDAGLSPSLRRPLVLSPSERSQLIAFLQSLE